MLNAQVASFGDRDPYSEIREFEPKTPYEWEYVIRMKINRAPLDAWSLTIGDCIYNLRASLDYAALALWRRHSGEPERIEDVQFPIYTKQAGYRGNRGRRIGGVHPDVKRIIRFAQPYQRRDDPESHPLFILQDLNNHDKHRAIHTAHAVLEDWDFEVIERHNAVVKSNSGLRLGGFKDGDPILRMTLLSMGTKPHVSVKLKTTYGIAFDKEGPGRGQPVVKLLGELREYIRDELLPPLEPYF